ncbi:hypothetical protein Taro_037883 [Colocasia esculenta]|uniref:Uncharacterized protein n=1 Tax=Colocasia esculenta TaxID=4460 RepID=A0A843WKK3_COLES|nr:hypothetical protein [Colocasia esculenta]
MVSPSHPHQSSPMQQPPSASSISLVVKAKGGLALPASRVRIAQSRGSFWVTSCFLAKTRKPEAEATQDFLLYVDPSNLHWQGEESVPSNGEVADGAAVAPAQPGSKHPLGAAEHRDVVVHGGEELPTVRRQLRVAQLLVGHLPFHQAAARTPAQTASGATAPEVHKAQVVVLVHHADGPALLHGDGVQHPLLIQGGDGAGVRPGPDHPLLPEVQQANVTVVRLGEQRGHHEAVAPVQPLELVGVSQGAPRRLVEEVRLLAGDLVPDPDPVLVAPPLAAGEDPVVGAAETEGPCREALDLVVVGHLEPVPEIPRRRAEQAHAPFAFAQALAGRDHDLVGVDVADVVHPLVVKADRGELLQHPVVDVHHAAVGHAAAAVGTGADGGAVPGGAAGYGTG